MDKQGYISQMKSMVSELRQYEISAEDLEDILENLASSPELYYKLQDIKPYIRDFLIIWKAVLLHRKKCWMPWAELHPCQKIKG